MLEEIEKIHIEQGKEGEADRFALRNPAATRVYARLGEDEKAGIEKTINSSVQPENPPDIQRKYVYTVWANIQG